MPIPRKPVELPKFPASAGPETAAQAPAYQATYRRLADQLRRELQRTEEAFAEALARVDQAATTRSRIDALAATKRNTTGRNSR
jgi:hypothetical protein